MERSFGLQEVPRGPRKEGGRLRCCPRTPGLAPPGPCRCAFLAWFPPSIWRSRRLVAVPGRPETAPPLWEGGEGKAEGGVIIDRLLQPAQTGSVYSRRGSEELGMGGMWLARQLGVCKGKRASCHRPRPWLVMTQDRPAALAGGQGSEGGLLSFP